MDIEYCDVCGNKDIVFPENKSFAICYKCNSITEITITSNKIDKFSLFIWKTFYKNKKLKK